LAVFAALFLLFRNIRIHHSLALCLFLAFWAAYFSRLYISLHILGEPTTFPASHYWIWSVGATFIPSLAVLTSYKPVFAESLHRSFSCVAPFATAVLLAAGGTTITTLSGELADHNRWNTDSLNPISMGHIGVTTFLLGVSLFFNGVSDFKHRNRVLLAFFAIGLGALLTIYANSRGPLVALVAALGLMLVAGVQKRRTWWLVFAMGLASAFAWRTIAEVLFANDGIFDRISAIQAGNDLSSIYRMISFAGAWDQFTQNPIFGNAIEEQRTQYYPHNVLLESLMATGLIGSIPFIGITVLALYSAWRILRRGAGDLWIGLLTVQYITAHQFSGALYNSTTMWMTIALAIAHYASTRSPRHAVAIQTRPGLVGGLR
ncbi:O-antigen ligase family protein, partial [Sulfitobacter sp. HI0023]|uniref:O-antigen ligase family protein n=5 Tax=unclassified Sulfitobacter TaxID=196795 RepID=UPI000A9AE8B7